MFVAIYEAHCISHCGHDFRPEYLALGELLASHPRRASWPALVQLTAQQIDGTTRA